MFSSEISSSSKSVTSPAQWLSLPSNRIFTLLALKVSLTQTYLSRLNSQYSFSYIYVAGKFDVSFPTSLHLYRSWMCYLVISTSASWKFCSLSSRFTSSSTSYGSPLLFSPFISTLYPEIVVVRLFFSCIQIFVLPRQCSRHLERL